MVYLLTFGCYGNRLPGDARGSVERVRSGRGGPIAPSQTLASYVQHLQLSPSVIFSLTEANTVLKAIQNVCTYRGWELIAAHVRTNHVHVVADVNVEPNRAIGTFKAYASRALNESARNECRWSRHGSFRVLATWEAIDAAVHYVTVRQGEPMAVFVERRGEHRHEGGEHDSSSISNPRI